MVFFFRQNTRYSMLFLLYLCLFIMVFALLMLFLYKIFKYLKDNEHICKTVQKIASELAQTWNR
jgi:hypothetical protein